MPIYQAVILAIVQGLTEFLPVSSSAHLAIAPWILGWPDQGLAFDIALHFGTLVAVLVYFMRDWLQILAQALGLDFQPDPELRMNRGLLWLLVIGTVPVGVAGLLFEHTIEHAIRDNKIIIGIMLVGVGVLMLIADRLSRRNRGIATISLTDALVIGGAQAIAIVPGTSRSGITITAGLFRDLDRRTAARFSFLLSTPAIAAAALKSFYDLHKQGGIPPELRLQFLIGVVTSAVVGSAVIAFFLRYLHRHSLSVFIWYRIAFGIMVIALALVLR